MVILVEEGLFLGGDAAGCHFEGWGVVVVKLEEWANALQVRDDGDGEVAVLGVWSFERWEWDEDPRLDMATWARGTYLIQRFLDGP